MGWANKLCYYYMYGSSGGGHAFLLKIRLCQVLALQLSEMMEVKVTVSALVLFTQLFVMNYQLYL